MKQSSDLHTHTTASDGQYSPSEVVHKAKEAGIQCLAITDHDTVDGLEEAIAAGESCGITVLGGVELGAKEDRHLHILGISLDKSCEAIRNLCIMMKKSREERKYRIVDFLKEKGVIISLEEVEALAQGGVVARPHFAQVLLKNGYVSSTREAFDRYLDTDEYQRIERFKADAQTCIETIHQSGGKAVLAHPYQMKLTDELLDTRVGQLKEMGLDGIECYYPQHTPAMIQQYLFLSKKYGLYISAGSDFHGENVHPDKPLKPVQIDTAWLFSS